MECGRGRTLLDQTEKLAEQTGPLKKRSLKREVFDVLQRRIIAGAYSPGRWLRQSEIAEELEVSLTPVREALDQLVADGLAQRVPYRGVRVPTFTGEEIADAYAVRVMIEVPVAGAAAWNISPKQGELLLDLIHRTEDLHKPDDMVEYRHLNWRIHRSIARAAGNPFLARLHGIAMNRFPDWMLYENLLQKPDELRAGLGREYEEHLVLARAVVGGQPETAAGAALRHLHGIRQEITASLGVPEDVLKKREEEIRSLG